jgi:hypothetical protein
MCRVISVTLDWMRGDDGAGSTIAASTGWMGC